MAGIEESFLSEWDVFLSNCGFFFHDIGRDMPNDLS